MQVILMEARGRYAEFLATKSIAQQYINKCQKYKCQKYLRYYLDFCHKHRYEETSSQK